jgi:type II secretory pathway component GspD/PulD (secretin)
MTSWLLANAAAHLVGARLAIAPTIGAATPSSPPAVQAKAPGGRVTNAFVDVDIKTAIAESANQAGVTVIIDDSVKDRTISMTFRDEPFESVLEKLVLTFGGAWMLRSPGVFLVSSGQPDSPLFREMSTSELYIPENQSVETLMALLSPAVKPFVMVDRTANLIKVTAPATIYRQVLRELQMADSASRQFVVEALVTEVGVESGQETGFSWNWKRFSVDDRLNLGYSTASVADVARLRALIANGKATLRANPVVTAFEGRETSLSVGQETYYSLVAGNVSFQYSQIQLIRTGVMLKFSGFVARDGTITLRLDPEVSDAVVQVNGNPTTNVRRASTNVRVKPGETIAIGGLVQDVSSRRVVRVPLLGNIPLVGELFTQRLTQTRRVETIILITPRLTEQGTGNRLGLGGGG